MDAYVALTVPTIMVRLLGAGIIGALIGYEWRMHHKSIGIAGMMLVALGSATYMLLAQHLTVSDPSAYAVLHIRCNSYVIIPHSERMFVLGWAMALRLLLTLPLPPGVNNQYVTVNGRRVLSPEARRYKQGVLKLLRRKRNSGEISDALCVAARRGYLALFIDFFFETPMRRDLDGGLKIAQDAICTALDVNDNRVVDIHLVKRIDPLNPRIEIELEVLDDWSFEYEHEVLVR